MGQRSIFIQRHALRHEHTTNRRGLILTMLFVLFMTILVVQQVRGGFASNFYQDFHVYQSPDKHMKVHVDLIFPLTECEYIAPFAITNQFVFSSPLPKLIDTLQLTDEKNEKGEALGCSVVGTVLAPRVDGMFWIQRNPFAHNHKRVNLTHKVNQISFHTENATDYVKPSSADALSTSDARFSAMILKPFLTPKESDRNLMRGIGGWTFTFPELEQTSPTEDFDEVQIDHYVYEIGLTPNAHQLDTEYGVKTRMSYQMQFLPQHIRFFRSDAFGAWQDFEETSQASYAIRADAVAFSYDIIDIAARLREKKPQHLTGIVARVLSALGGIYAFFVLAERLMVVLPTLFGKKMD